MVQSFTRDPDIWYVVKVEDLKVGADECTAIVSCDCPAFKLHQLKCKHMFLAGRFTGIPLRFGHSYLSTPSTQHSPITSISEEDVLSLKDAGRMRIIQEGKKIGDLIQKLTEMDLEGLTRDQLGSLETRSTSLRRELYDVVNSRPLYAPQR